jgi:hypothetical protein
MIIPRVYPPSFALPWLTLRRPQQGRWIARRKDLKTGKFKAWSGALSDDLSTALAAVVLAVQTAGQVIDDVERYLLGGDARGRDGSVRQELAARITLKQAKIDSL